MARKKAPGIGLMVHVKNILFSSQGFPIFLVFTVFGLLFVVFRMKTVELDYHIAAQKTETEKQLVDNKELKAKKAKLLSVGRLRDLADKYGLSQPKKNQIIVVP